MLYFIYQAWWHAPLYFALSAWPVEEWGVLMRESYGARGFAISSVLTFGLLAVSCYYGWFRRVVRGEWRFKVNFEP